MDETESRERKAFLSDVEERFTSGENDAILALAGERLRRLPGDPDARIALCRIWIRQERLDEAREMLQELEEPLAGLSRVYAALGDSCLKKGREEEARTFYKKRMALNAISPPMPEISERLKDSDARYKAEEDADETADGAEEEAPDIPADFQTVTLAELYIRQGHPAQAAEVLEAILRRDPQQAKAAEMLREVREGLGRDGDWDAGDKAPIVAELSRWLERIVRRRTYGE